MKEKEEQRRRLLACISRDQSRSKHFDGSTCDSDSLRFECESPSCASCDELNPEDAHPLNPMNQASAISECSRFWSSGQPVKGSRAASWTRPQIVMREELQRCQGILLHFSLFIKLKTKQTKVKFPVLTPSKRASRRCNPVHRGARIRSRRGKCKHRDAIGFAPLWSSSQATPAGKAMSRHTNTRAN